jgi:hypothetical protein
LGISTPEDDTTTSQNAMVKEKEVAENCTTENWNQELCSIRIYNL